MTDQDLLTAYLALSRRWGTPLSVLLGLLGTTAEGLATWEASGEVILTQGTRDYLNLVLSLWGEALLTVQPSAPPELQRIAKLLSLGGDRNPNPHERQSAQEMAADLMARHGVNTEDVRALALARPRNRS